MVEKCDLQSVSSLPRRGVGGDEFFVLEKSDRSSISTSLGCGVSVRWDEDDVNEGVDRREYDRLV